jgi:hypothetical protein
MQAQIQTVGLVSREILRLDQNELSNVHRQDLGNPKPLSFFGGAELGRIPDAA